jgi:uncharacterized protein involved in exopolysaccharide biosynthesis
MATREQFAIGDYLRVVFKRKALIAGVFLAVTGGIGVTIFRQPIIYEVSGKLLVTRARADLVLSPQVSGGSSPGYVFPQQQDLTAEVELLKSRTLSKAVVENLALNRPGEASANKTPVMLASLLEMPASLASWLPPGLVGSPAGRGEDEPGQPSRLDRMAAGIQRGLQIQVIPNSNVIEVRYRSTDPQRAVDIVNTLLQLYLDRYPELRRPHGVTAFFASQRTIYEEKLRDAEAALRDFEGRTALINASAQLEVYSRQLAEAELTLQKVHFNVLDKRQKLASTKAHLASTPERIVSSQTNRYNPLIDIFETRLLEMEMEREKLLQSYTPQDRRVQDIEGRIVSLKRRLGEQREWVPSTETSQIHPLRASLQESLVGTETSLSRLKIDEDEANDLIVMLKRRIGEMAQLAVDRAELLREVRAHEEAYLLYRKKVEEARISEAMDEHKMMNVTIADEATTPLGPITSKNLSYVFALMVGLVGGVGSGFLREFFDDSVKTVADVTSTTALPVLASIPEQGSSGQNHGRTTGLS